ncbi:MAG: alpha/beta hydrolase [Rhodospirillales bacterium]|nr:alpha/beta hydrolase [Rhodospirillales bacterium]
MALELSVDGQTIFAATGGKDFDPGLPAIIFIHGASMNRTVWSAQARYFAHRGYGVLAPDLPGHGNSEGDLLPSIEAIADWIIRLMDAAGLRKAVLAGHSMGSLPVLEAAARHPDRIERIALLGISVPMTVADALLDNAEANHPSAYDMVTIWGHSKRAQIGGNAAPGIRVTGGSLRLLERGGDGVLHNDMKACNDYTGGLEAAARVSCPATLILGDGDMMTPPRRAKDLMAAMPSARMIVLKDCGHMMMSEQPNETLDALIRAVG